MMQFRLHKSTSAACCIFSVRVTGQGLLPVTPFIILPRTDSRGAELLS